MGGTCEVGELYDENKNSGETEEYLKGLGP